MKRIIDKIPGVAFALGKQDIDASLFYRRASFCVLTQSEGATVAYNSLTGELLELERGEESLFPDVAIPYSHGMACLIESYFLVPADFDEIAYCDNIKFALAKAAELSFRGYRSYTIFPTTDCNARCFYCYECGAKRISMDEETAEKTAEFIVSSCIGAVSITWYGGEPLMNTAAMDIISKRLLKADVPFTSVLATNGSLLDADTVKKAVELWNVEKVQVTIDGTKDIYNRIKAYADGREDAFSEVLCNIERLLDADIKVNIRLNVEEHNIDDMYALSEVLASRFGGRKGVNVYSAMLFDCEGAKRPATDGDGRSVLAEKIINIEDKLSELCVLHPRKLRRTFAHSYCKADSPSSIVITAEGKLVKCDFFTDSHFVGDVENGIDDGLLERESEMFAKRIDGKENCIGCTAYPVCLRLAACPTSSSPCDRARRFLTEERLIRSVRYAYKTEKEG